MRSDLSEATRDGQVEDTGRTGVPGPSVPLNDGDLADFDLTDAELTALALACDPDQPLDPEATPLDLYPDHSYGLLPRWYMPPVTAIGFRLWRTPVVVAIILAFLLIDAFGLCITYGQLVAA